MIDQPIFLVGAERSGTTLLRLMLDSHPEIAFAEEFEYAVELMGDDGSYPDMAAFERFLETNRMFSTSGFEFDASKPYPELIDGFLRSRQEAKAAPYVGATIHFGFAKALKIWPKAKLIHIIRDPRDVSPSCMAMGWAGNVWHGLDKWIEAEDEWAAVDNGLPEEQKLTVRYVDLVDDHTSTLASICRFIGVDYTSDMLSYSTETDYQEPRPGVARRWRGNLGDHDVQLIEARVGHRIEELGFEPSGLKPITVGPFRVSWLRWNDRWGKVKLRMQRFGLRLTLADLAARVLRNDDWQRSLRLRFNEIELIHRKKSWADESPLRTSR
ncbi:MAG: sulfotransferase [Acidimicrobiia bacterium]|nr:sulfotransferase [Acidimicrobiia bacterium]